MIKEKEQKKRDIRVVEIKNKNVKPKRNIRITKLSSRNKKRRTRSKGIKKKSRKSNKYLKSQDGYIIFNSKKYFKYDPKLKNNNNADYGFSW
jgi:hypothetical protein